MDNAFFDPWDHRFAFELAMALEPANEVCARYEVSEEQFEKLRKTPAFMKQVVDYRAEIKEKGLTFRGKAKIMSEDLLGTAYTMIHDPAIPANVKADLIKWVGKMADYEPKEQKNQEQQFLPAVAAAIKQLSDGDLELRVTQIVSRRAPTLIEGESL